MSKQYIIASIKEASKWMREQSGKSKKYRNINEDFPIDSFCYVIYSFMNIDGYRIDIADDDLKDDIRSMSKYEIDTVIDNMIDYINEQEYYIDESSIYNSIVSQL